MRLVYKELSCGVHQKHNVVIINIKDCFILKSPSESSGGLDSALYHVFRLNFHKCQQLITSTGGAVQSLYHALFCQVVTSRGGPEWNLKRNTKQYAQSLKTNK